MKKNNYLRSRLSVLLLFSTVLFWSQTVIRYSQNIVGGATIIGNSWYYSTTTTGTPRLTPDIDGDATTTRSTSADLILPAGSTIEKAYLSIEKDDFTNDPPAFTSVKIKVPGAASYTTLTSATSIANRTTPGSGWPTGQMIWDITSMMPAAGYVSTPAGGAAGRYFLADPLPAPLDMGGWSIIVVYKNPNSKYRNVTVFDDWQYFNNTGVSTTIAGIKVPPSGIVKAVVGVTGTYGDRGFSDLLSFGKTATALTALADPRTGATNDALNSSIAWGANNNVLADGVAVPTGNYVRRNPISAGHIWGASESYDYDADIFDATGILAPSATPISVTLAQQSTGNDILISGSYFISVDIAVPPLLTKTVSPATISDGGTSTYTWTVTNTAVDAISQTIAFTDALPSSIIVAAIPNASITGGTGGTITAAAGSNIVSISGLQLNPGQSATIKVDITNILGQLNATCAGNPSAFTNSASNITVPPASPLLDTSGMTPQCLVVTYTDSDGDGVPDTTDLDDDNDGILDTAEGYCNTQTVYTLNTASTLAGATFGANGGTFNLVYSLTSGTAVASLGNSFNVPFTYSDFNNSVNLQNHTWESFVNNGSSFAILPTTVPLYTGLPGNNTTNENFSGAATNTPDGWFRYLLSTNRITQLGTFTTTIGNLPAVTGLSSYNSNTPLNLFSSFNVGTVPVATATSGYYAKMQLQNTVNTANVASTLPLAVNYGTGYTWDYTAFTSTAGSGATNTGNRGLISISQNTITFCNHRDTDGDTIPDYLDLDSDNDGCTDAREGDENVTTAQLLTAGGTVTVGTGSTASNQNLGNTVDTNGVPTVVNSGGAADIGSDVGQGIGQSTDSSKNDCLDSDGDGLPDWQDLDDDNDGILDTVEGQCSSPSKSGTWTSSGTQATGTAGTVGITYNSTPLTGGNTNNSFTPTGIFNVTNFWYNAGIAGSSSLEFVNTWDITPETPGATVLAATDGGTRQVTINFTTPVNKLLLNIDRLGGNYQNPLPTDPYISNSVQFTLTTPNITLSKIAGNSQLIVSGNKFYREPNINLGTVNPGTEASNTTGSAAGTIQITKNDGSSFTSITFTVAGVGVEGVGNDGMEMIFETCTDRDTDGDTIPDYLDLDSDNDGCLDAIEGGANILPSQLVAAGGTLTVGIGSTASNQNLCTASGCVDANGVPTIVNGGQGLGDSANASAKSQCTDSDGDGVPDNIDLDDDNDGILDTVESPSCFSCTLGTTNRWTSYQTSVGNSTVLPPAVDESSTFNTQNPETIISTKFPNTDPFGFGIPWYNAMTLKATNNTFGVIDELISTNPQSEWHVNMAIWQPPVAMTNQVLRIRTNNNGFYSAPATGLTETSKLFAKINDGVSPMLSAAAGIDYNYNEVNLGVWNGTSCIILALYMFDQSLQHDNGVIEYWNGTAWTTLPTSFVSAMPAITPGCTNDADGDTIPNHLDLDSDNDGCLDALEGGDNIVSSQLVNAGGTVTVGTGSTASNQNLCGGTTCVGSTGIPTIVNQTTGQGIGDSENVLVQSGCFCYKPAITSGTVLDTNHGITALGRAGNNNDANTTNDWPMVRKGAWTALEAKTKGFVVNRILTTAQVNAIATPVEGMMVYDEEADCLKIYTTTDNGSTFSWQCFSTQACP